MNTLSSKLTAFAAALTMNGLVFGALGISLRAAVSTERVSDRSRQGSRRASVTQLEASSSTGYSSSGRAVPGSCPCSTRRRRGVTLRSPHGLSSVATPLSQLELE